MLVFLTQSQFFTKNPPSQPVQKPPHEEIERAIKKNTSEVSPVTTPAQQTTKPVPQRAVAQKTDQQKKPVSEQQPPRKSAAQAQNSIKAPTSAKQTPAKTQQPRAQDSQPLRGEVKKKECTFDDYYDEDENGPVYRSGEAPIYSPIHEFTTQELTQLFGSLDITKQPTKQRTKRPAKHTLQLTIETGTPMVHKNRESGKAPPPAKAETGTTRRPAPKTPSKTPSKSIFDGVTTNYF